MRRIVSFLCVLAFSASAQEPTSFSATQRVLKTYCAGCHQGRKPMGGFQAAPLLAANSVVELPVKWSRVLARVRDSEMPPKGAPALPAKEREQFVAWVDTALHQAACADGIAPGRAPLRRLNRGEYGSTVRDLLNIHINAGHGLPAEGAGGEGFDNAAETLFLSPIHAEKYLEAAKLALEYAFSDTRSRARFLTDPNATLSPEEAARKTLDAFLPKAFRRPARPGDMDKYMALFQTAMKRGDSYEQAMQYALQGVLMSPHFLFRLESPNPNPPPRLLDDYALASRLSYFLWGSMPDQTLFDLASKGTLHETETLIAQVPRMLKDAHAHEFADRFVDQWLNIRELGRDIKPDRQLFPTYYDAEIQSAMRYEPILFFQEIMAENLSLMNLIDSKFTILTNRLARHYDLKIAADQKISQQPKRIELPENSHRGGLLGMAAVLAVSSLPTRTSPVLRGKWILESVLGTPPPPPPPSVPLLKEHDAQMPQTLRERLELHRQNAVCAGCHNKIDPLGFGLENYDVLGRWRTEDAGKPIDSKGELPDGTIFNGPQELKGVLLARKDLLFRNLTGKLLGYALGRGLTLEEYCTVDRIMEKLKQNDYASHVLIREIVLSIPFRYQTGTAQNMSVRDYHQ
ncbi:MAG: DUF1592 domain-containing protein [Candidatus Solibacter usitatus]|nr:DUF1592 domain-containing protein [Candidatus Solibacter usitatus]